jgi:CHAD domain-containing protein/HD superfamily phosphodiesterase
MLAQEGGGGICFAPFPLAPHKTDPRQATSPAIRARLSVEELCTKYGNEEPHSRHVAALALRLFDETHRLFGIPPTDRPLLEAACRLHDIGYGVNPRRHGEIGERIVRSEGLRGFAPSQRECIATVISLHHSALEFETARARANRSADSRRVLHLAALLRIADGLDYSHLQDARIASVQGTKRKIRVNVRFSQFPRAIEVARRHASLWREAFPADIDLRLLAGSPSRSEPLLEPLLTIHEAIRRLMFLQYRTLLINVDAAIHSADSEALHDLRIGVRRMRAVLRAFRKPLEGTSAERVNLDLQRLNRVLGVARDLDVWIGFCSKESIAAQFTGHRLWAGFVAHQLETRRLQQATVRRHLHGAGFSGLRIRIGRLLRFELPAASRSGPPLPQEGPARRAIAKYLRRVQKLAHLRHSRSPEKIHRLRIALRRVRYLSGFFSEVLGRPVQRLFKRSHAVESVIGQIRDADLALARILSEGPTPPRMLVRQLEKLRQADTAEMDGAWKRLTDPQFAAELTDELYKPATGKK